MSSDTFGLIIDCCTCVLVGCFTIAVAGGTVALGVYLWRDWHR